MYAPTFVIKSLLNGYGDDDLNHFFSLVSIIAFSFSSWFDVCIMPSPYSRILIGACWSIFSFLINKLLFKKWIFFF